MSDYVFYDIAKPLFSHWKKILFKYILPIFDIFKPLWGFIFRM